jgi:hypothetical protein
MAYGSVLAWLPVGPDALRTARAQGLRDGPEPLSGRFEGGVTVDAGTGRDRKLKFRSAAPFDTKPNIGLKWNAPVERWPRDMNSPMLAKHPQPGLPWPRSAPCFLEPISQSAARCVAVRKSGRKARGGRVAIPAQRRATRRPGFSGRNPKERGAGGTHFCVARRLSGPAKRRSPRLELRPRESRRTRGRLRDRF